DRIRRENKRGDKQREASMLYDDEPTEQFGTVDDERLRLIFTCCNPALSMENRVALTLRMVGGLTVPEIARAFLVQETTIGQRISRAKAKIKATRIPYRVPSAEDLPGGFPACSPYSFSSSTRAISRPDLQPIPCVTNSPLRRSGSLV
ncbi:MAG TPA: sigma factor-like helix-turn-helix DNA-binding protein, partial [Acidimicrobiales bacterium]|nr:sigma factor-like helix-turn-helix DNA-binding protein [Acidimicrobiales bacterium]